MLITYISMRTTITQSTRKRGFTIVELIVLVMVIGMVATLLLPLFAQMRATALNRGCRANLRQISLAIELYAKNNQDRLPGPLWMGQPFEYTEKSSNSLPYYLADYLMTPIPSATPALSQSFLCPGYERFAPLVLLSAERVSLIANQSLAPAAGRKLRPFGYPKRFGTPASQPLDWPTLDSYGTRSKLWALTDADKKNNLPENNPWYSQLPTKPVHGNYRNKLYFDAHVGAERVR